MNSRPIDQIEAVLNTPGQLRGAWASLPVAVQRARRKKWRRILDEHYAALQLLGDAMALDLSRTGYVVPSATAWREARGA